MLAAGILVATAKSVSDPNEAAATARDIRTAKLNRPQPATFVWTMITWDAFDSADLIPTGMTLYLDTKGGTANDAFVELTWTSFRDELSCQVTKPSGTFIAVGSASRPSSKSVVCRFPKSALTLEKRIRWRTASENVFYTDKAPDSGYVTGV